MHSLFCFLTGRNATSGLSSCHLDILHMMHSLTVSQNKPLSCFCQGILLEQEEKKLRHSAIKLQETEPHVFILTHCSLDSAPRGLLDTSLKNGQRKTP